MNENILQNLEHLQKQSFFLKEKFSKTENKKWSASTVASELVLQITHLAYSLLGTNERRDIYPTPGIDKGTKDELSDVLFNALNLLSFLNLTIVDINKSMLIIANDTRSSNVTSVLNLMIQSANLWDNVARLDGYKHLDKDCDKTLDQVKLGIAGIIQFIFIIAQQQKVDLICAMKEMFIDADRFIKSHEDKKFKNE
ncbi:hypothetical protein COZ82_00195 [Candidatus Kaiserbacteria bacterium CG_4_8_14_3_um_filter_38_9]|uniref:Uncharacterized protein n=1 Tax=Candidatus Kaiserbacteria bacterium CG_4_8_14_3_um_filter_38_9 TaxID=1974599 RepID=A0A2M7IPU0_9BACT|nr:MAG: hypothetical protein COZ82_00195 [Candidatus Kaiserbacteria bacterium CG_4_8_14_3_um_filter_38_9]